MAGHSFGVGGLPACYCPLCLSLGRIGTTILDKARSPEFRSFWLDKVRLFTVQVQDAAAVDTPLAAPPAGGIGATPKATEGEEAKEKTPERGVRHREETKEPEPATEEEDQKKEKKSKAKKEEKPGRERQRRRRADQSPVLDKSPSPSSKGKEKKSRDTPTEREEKRRKREDTPIEREGKSPKHSNSGGQSSGSRPAIAVKTEPSSSVEKKRRKKERRGEERSLPRSSKKRSPSPEEDYPELGAKSKPRPPSYPPPRHQGGRHHSWRARDEPAKKWSIKEYYSWSDSKGKKKRERREEINQAGGLEAWHASKSERESRR